ncbi:MAG: GNAT family N-acetyltransferase, partial [Chloroflexota bacterium]
AAISHIAHVTWDATYHETIAVENRQDFLKRAYERSNLAPAIDVEGHWFYVAQSDMDVVGFAHFSRRYHPTQSRAELLRCYVLPENQRRGIGSALLNRGFTDLGTSGISQCFVSVQASNTKAQKFYERHQFVYHRDHGQFLGTQIITLKEYIRPIVLDEGVS